MDILNSKTVEEFNTTVYFEKLNLLIIDFIDNYQEMVFLKDAQKTIKSLEAHLKKKPSDNLDIISTPAPLYTPIPLLTSMPLPDVKPSENSYKDCRDSTLFKPKIKIIPPIKKPKILHNYFYLNTGEYIKLTKEQNISLYEELLHKEISITNENEKLYNIIEKSLTHIYKMKNNNIEIEVIKLLNIPKELLIYDIMNELNSLIKYHPNKKNYNIHDTHFKLTQLSFVMGTICLNAFCNSHKDPIIRKIFNAIDLKEHLPEYNNLIEDLLLYPNIQDNLYFLKLFNLTIEEPQKKDISFNDIEEFIENNSSEEYYDEDPIIKHFKIINNSSDNKEEFSYNAGQYFYKIIRTLLLKDVGNTTGLHFTILKNKNHIDNIRIGSVFLHTFKKFNLFQENLVFNHKKKEIILFVPNIKYFPNHISNIVHQRPYFVYETIETLMAKYDTKKDIFNTIEYYIYNICSTRYKLRIHKNRSINMKPTNKNRYKKLKMFSGRYYLKNFEKFTSFVGTVDKTYFYEFLLMIKDILHLKNNIKEFSFEQNIERYSNLFILYKIKPTTLIDLYKKNDLVYKRLLEHLFEYALDFNLQNNKIFIKEIQENLKPSFHRTEEPTAWRDYNKAFKVLSTIYNKVYSYKIFIRGLISECLIYSHFDHFIFDAFLDARGRHYLNGFYMNPQSYPLIKAFIKPYISDKQTITYEQFKLLKTIPSKKLSIIESKEVSALLEQELPTYKRYLMKEAKLKIEYILTLFENPSLSLETLICDLQNLKQNYISDNDLFYKSLLYIKKYTTNIKKFYVLHSAILLHLIPRPKITNYYELDATASGLQMTAMVLRDANLGELCNLTLSSNKKRTTNDLYMMFSQDSVYWFIRFFNTICNINIPKNIKNICYTLFDFFHNKTKKKTIEIVSLIKTLIPLLTEEISLKFKELLDLYNTYNWIIFSSYKIKNKILVKCLIKAIKIEDPTDIVYEVLYNYIYIIGGFVHLNNLININKEHQWFFQWLSGRDVFKKAIMTFGYNATSFRRKEQFFKALLEQNENKMTKSLKFLGQILENLFIVLKDEYLPSAQVLRDFGTILTRNMTKNPVLGTSIVIDNGIFEMELKAYKNKASRVRVSGLLNSTEVWHELQINNPLFLKQNIKNFIDDSRTYLNIFRSFDTKILARKFAPNFIHSMDAWLICNFKYKIAKINDLFDETLFINNITNHDTFGLTIAPFLKYILMDIYKNLYFFDYLCTLNQSSSYHQILYLWCRKILLNLAIRKLNFRKEAHLGSPVTLLYPIYHEQLGYRVIVDLGTTTNLILNPSFVK